MLQIVLLSHPQALVNQIYVYFGSTNATGRFFLETMQHVNRLLKAHCINHPESVAPFGFNQLQHPRAFTLPGLGLRRHCAQLHSTQCVTKVVHHISGHGH